MKFTNEQMTRLLRMKSQGFSNRGCAEIMGCSRKVISNRLRRHSALNDFNEDGVPKDGIQLKVSIKTIVEIVSDEYGVEPIDVFKQGRSQKFARARFVAMWLARHDGGYRDTDIARRFRRDPSAVAYAVGKVGSFKELPPEATRAQERVRFYKTHGFDKGAAQKVDEPEDPPMRVIVHEPDKRATVFVPRAYKPCRIIRKAPRVVNVTGALLGDPGHASYRIATNQTSRGES